MCVCMYLFIFRNSCCSFQRHSVRIHTQNESIGCKEKDFPVTIVMGLNEVINTLHTHTFAELRDYTVKSCFVFQRLRALQSQLKFIWFANCLHVGKGERTISFHCNLKFRNYGFSSPTRKLQAWRAPGTGAGPRGGMQPWYKAPFCTHNNFGWLWDFDLMKD